MVFRVSLVDPSHTRRVAYDTALPSRRRRFRAIDREAINLEREGNRAYEKGKSSLRTLRSLWLISFTVVVQLV